MTIITDDMIRELRWLAHSKLTITVVPKPVLAELVAVWEAAKLAHSPTASPLATARSNSGRSSTHAGPELPLFQPDPYPPDRWHDHIGD
jgi:hypothetical protein